MKKFILIIVAFISLSGFAQEKGTIVGKLTDKEANNEPLPFANILIKGTIKGTTTDFDGLYSIENVEPGAYTLIFSFVGYETQEVNIEVVSGKVTEVNVALGASAAALDEIVITTTTKRESEVALLLEQKKAVEIKQSIGAQELSRKGVSDAEAAVTKVSGVSKSEGSKNVFVRGLGDRYNSTSLNGLPLPSEDPEYKNIALDFFSSDIIESIGINKVFNSELYGNVGGADIDIVSKEMTGQSMFEISLGSGFNSNAIGADFYSPDGTNRLGTGLDKDSPITSLLQYDFDNGFTPVSRNSVNNYSGSVMAGKRFNIGENGNSLSAFVTLSASNDYVYKEGNIAQYNSAGFQPTDMEATQSEYFTTQLGMLNLKYRFGGNTIALNNGVIRKVTQTVGEYSGEASRVSDQTELEDFIRRQQTNKNNLFVNQVLTSFKLKENLKLNLDGSYNFIRSSEPDRRNNSFIKRLDDNEDFYRVAIGSAGLNHRFFSDLEEDDVAAKAALTYKFASSDDETSTNNAITVGGNFRNTQRTFTFRQFNFDFGSQEIVDINNPDALFNQANLTNGTFELVTDRGRFQNPNALDPFYYEGDRTIIGGYAQGVYDITPKLTVSAGLRFENVNQEVAWDTSLSSSVNDPNLDNALIEDTYILPSASVKYNFNDNSIVRLAASQSYILPQYKEVAPFLYDNVNDAVFGNPFLESSTVYNVDMKYDYFFSNAELVSVTGFFKMIQDPINRVRVNSAANELSYVNVGDATVAGIELEFRKSVFKKEISDDKKSDLMFGLNFSYLYSNQKLEDNPNDNLTVRFNVDEDELEGASPILANTDFTYNYKAGELELTSSVVGNYFSDRIYAIGTAGNENFVENSRITLDFINKLKLNEHFGLSLNLKNLLNPDFEVTQEVMGEDKAISTFKRGVNGSFGVTYKF